MTADLVTFTGEILNRNYIFVQCKFNSHIEDIWKKAKRQLNIFSRIALSEEKKNFHERCFVSRSLATVL